MKYIVVLLLIFFLFFTGYLTYKLGIWEHELKPRLVDYLELKEQTGETLRDSIQKSEETFEEMKTKKEQEHISNDKKLQDDILEQQRQEMDRIKKEIDSLLVQEDEIEDDGNIKKISRIYESMKPKDVAKLAINLDEKFIARILTYMKPRRAGKVMGEITKIDPEKSAELSQLMLKLK